MEWSNARALCGSRHIEISSINNYIFYISLKIKRIFVYKRSLNLKRID